MLDGKTIELCRFFTWGCTGMYVIPPYTQGIGSRPDSSTTVVEAAKHGVTAGGDTVSGLLYADDLAGVSETPGGLQKQINGESARIHK